MFRYRSVTAAIAVAALLATGLAFAQGPRGGGPFGRGGPGGDGRGPGFALGALNLTDAQRDQIRDIRERNREQSQAVNQRLGAALEKQRQAIETVPVNEALITSLTQDLSQAQVEVALQQARLNAEMFAVLTPEQQAQLKKIRADQQNRIDERKQRAGQRRNR